MSRGRSDHDHLAPLKAPHTDVVGDGTVQPSYARGHRRCVALVPMQAHDDIGTALLRTSTFGHCQQVVSVTSRRAGCLQRVVQQPLEAWQLRQYSFADGVTLKSTGCQTHVADLLQEHTFGGQAHTVDQFRRRASGLQP